MDGKQVSEAQQIVDQLYRLQKQYFKDMLLGENAQQLQRERIAYFFQTSDTVTLNQIIDVEQLVGVVQSQVYKINFKPALLSVIGEIAQNIHIKLNETTAPLADFASDQQIEHWLRKILELDEVFDYIRTQIEHTPQIRSLCAYWINQNIEHFSPKNLHQVSEKTLDRLPESLQRFFHAQAQKLEEQIEIRAAQLFQQQLLFLFHLEKEEYLTLGMSLWESIKYKSVAEFTNMASPLDSEELFILSYEFWKDFRHNDTFQQIIKEGIHYFYDTFAEETIYELFLSTGLKIEDIQLEAERFAPSILKRLDELNLLDAFIDQMIQPFFQAEQTIDQVNQILNIKS
jgi:hypothetical protein